MKLIGLLRLISHMTLFTLLFLIGLEFQFHLGIKVIYFILLGAFTLARTVYVLIKIVEEKEK